MVPDSTKRLENAYEDLQRFLTNEGAFSEQQQQESSEWWTVATKLLREHETATAETTEDDVPTTQTNVDDLAEGEAF